jgi:mono/diheme cytochrome c family protein
MRTFIACVILVGAALPAASQPAAAQPADGAAVYRAACQVCHMPDGRGAVGAGAYPALAGNARLDSAPYAITLVLRGQRAMPGVGRFLTDAQVAAVVGYIRTSLGNRFDGAVQPEDVAGLR